MTNFGRTIAMTCLFLGVLVLAPNSWGQNRPPILEQIAKTYGVDSFGKIEAIRYTWNGNPRPARSPTKVRIKTASS
jgi:hypothetical protein